MNTPKPKNRPWKEEPKEKPIKHDRRKHTNTRFYTSSSWRNARKNYINTITQHQWDTISLMPAEHKLYLLDKVPICERCLMLYLLGARNTIETAKELDHINPVNPDNALDTMNGKWGEPLNSNNYQFLCRTHHSKKSQRDKRIIKLRT